MAAINASEKIEETTLDSVTQVLRLSKLQIKAVLSAIGCRSDAETVPKDAVTHLILADLLEHLKFLTPEARTLILQNIWENKTEPEKNAPCCVGDHVFFADSRYCSWIGAAGWLDLETGDKILMLPGEPIETIAYNLIALQRLAQAAIESRSEKNVKQNARSMEKSGHVRVSSPDPIS